MKKRRLHWLLCLVMMFGMMIGATMSAKAATKTITWGGSVLKKITIGYDPDEDLSKSFTNGDGITATWSSGIGGFYYDEDYESSIINMEESNSCCLQFSSTVGKFKKITITCTYGSFDGSLLDWNTNYTVDEGFNSFQGDATWNGNPAKTVELSNKGTSYLLFSGITKISFTVDTTVNVTGVSLNKSSTSLTVGGTETLTATVTPSDATDPSVTWSSSNTAVATVDSNGKVTGVAPGTATITVTTTDGSKTASCAVTVSDKITIAKTPKLKKAKAKKGKVTVTWKKIKKTKKTKALLKQIKSIQVQYSTDPTFTTNVLSKNVGKKKSSVKLKLQRKTVYYIRMRYVGSDGYSNWSNVKTVKTK